MASVAARLLLLALSGTIGACSPASSAEAQKQQRLFSTASPDAPRVMVVQNSNSPESGQIADYYLSRRGIPRSNLVTLSAPNQEEITYDEYLSKVETPIRAALRRTSGIDFVVLTKGVPLRADGPNGRSVDSLLASMNLVTGEAARSANKLKNPFGASRERFSSDKFNMVLVTRLDGYTVADVKRLVDNSVAAKSQTGWFLMDEAANRRNPGYGELQATFRVAERSLKGKGLVPKVEDTPSFWAPVEKLMGYISWGSNDDKFDEATYKRLRFHPGAIAETFVSTSGRTFNRTSGGQSLIADLVASGVTGVKGYVSEPYLFAMAQPQILFDRYTGGFNLAEAFYAASPVVRWKDVIIGDPLCRPFGG